MTSRASRARVIIRARARGASKTNVSSARSVVKAFVARARGGQGAETAWATRWRRITRAMGTRERYSETLDVIFSGELRAPIGVLIVIPGLTDGPDSLEYARSGDSALGVGCRARGVALARFELSSGGDGYGTLTLEDDARELDALIAHVMKTRPSVREVTLLGHSTGCQSICHFLSTRRASVASVNKIVLQAGVSDRDWYDKDHGADVMRAWIERAEAMAPEELMPADAPGTYGVPTNARRYLSLAKPGGEDDWFSLDLFDGTNDAASKIPTLVGCEHIDVRLVVSTQDEYVPYDAETVLAHAERVRASFERIGVKSATALHLCANHDLSDMRPEDVPTFVDFVFS